MIIFRPHCGSLREAMDNSKEFDSLKDLLNYIIQLHNKSYPFFQINDHDLNICLYTENDNRVKWHDVFIITIESYNRIRDKNGYLKYFNGKKYDHPCGVLGYFSTNYEKI